MKTKKHLSNELIIGLTNSELIENLNNCNEENLRYSDIVDLIGLTFREKIFLLRYPKPLLNKLLNENESSQELLEDFGDVLNFFELKHFK